MSNLIDSSLCFHILSALSVKWEVIQRKKCDIGIEILYISNWLEQSCEVSTLLWIISNEFLFIWTEVAGYAMNSPTLTLIFNAHHCTTTTKWTSYNMYYWRRMELLLFISSIFVVLVVLTFSECQIFCFGMCQIFQ